MKNQLQNLMYKNPIKLQKILDKIYLHYCYEFPEIKNTELWYNNGYGCNFNWSNYIGQKFINIDFDYIEGYYDFYETIDRHGEELTAEEFAVVVLLHEIGHCIDFHYNNKRYLKEQKTMVRAMREADYKFMDTGEEVKHTDFPMEKRADKFANEEFKMWRKRLTNASEM